MNANTTKTIIGTLLPFASNPIVLAVLGAGAAAWAIASLFDNDNEDEDNGSNTAQSRSEPSNQPFKRNRSTVQSTVREPFRTPETIVATEDSEPLVQAIPTEEVEASAHLHKDNSAILDNGQAFTVEVTYIDDEAVKKEMIRKTMSELGKRSGAARRKAKIDRYVVPE